MRLSGEIWEHVNGTSVPNLDAGSLLDGKAVPMPSNQVLDRFSEFILPICQRSYAGENNALVSLREALLPKLISGELRIPDVNRVIERTET